MIEVEKIMALIETHAAADMKDQINNSVYGEQAIRAAIESLTQERDAWKEQAEQYCELCNEAKVLVEARTQVQQEPTGMAVQALAGEIVDALMHDEKDGGYDLEGGLFGPAFSTLVRRWAVAEYVKKRFIYDEAKTSLESERKANELYNLREVAQAIIAEASKEFGFLKLVSPIPKELIDALKDAVLETMK